MEAKGESVYCLSRLALGFDMHFQVFHWGIRWFRLARKVIYSSPSHFSCLCDYRYHHTSYIATAIFILFRFERLYETREFSYNPYTGTSRLATFGA